MTDSKPDINTFNRCRVLVVGDLMIDEYLWGEVDRISPEAPVQVVSVQSEDFTLGGAGNVVNNLVALGAEVFTAGVIGTGRNGRRLLDIFRQRGLDATGIFQVPGRPTTRKTRVIAGSQHVLRIDRESRREISTTVLESMIRFLEKKVPDVDVILISDYGKGLVTGQVLSRLVDTARQHGKTTIADPKGLDFTKYRGVSLLTPNQKEAALAAGIEIGGEAALFKAGNKLLETAGIDNLLITCGKDGMVLFVPGCPPHGIRSQARQVYDVSGAGDTVLAVLGLSVASGASFEAAAHLANTAAGIVVGKVGTATVTKTELAEALGTQSANRPAKYKTMAELEEIAAALRKKGKRIVLTNGCFDVLHAGHVDLLTASKRAGDALIVALDDDASVKKLKGVGRPVIAERERVRILDAMDVVDYITVFATESLGALIDAVRPDVLTKGSNYSVAAVKGHERVKAQGGQVILIPVSGDASSTKIIRDIKNS